MSSAVNMIVVVGSCTFSWSSTFIQLQSQVITDEWGRMNSSINKLWSFVRNTDKKVEGLCSDIKKVWLYEFSFISLSEMFCKAH